MDKTCPECDNKVIGRSDKRFCSDYCRNSYNNKQNKDTTNLIRNTNNQSRKNYRILSNLNPNQKAKTTRGKLTSSGFDFNLYTNVYITKAGTTYYFVYNQGYLPLDNDYYALVKRD